MHDKVVGLQLTNANPTTPNVVLWKTNMFYKQTETELTYC